jgi:hypothetical protein
MWEQYKKTALGMQVVIAIVSVAVLILTRQLAAGALFFVAMQLSAVFGAAWATRLHRLQERGRALRLGRS